MQNLKFWIIIGKKLLLLHIIIIMFQSSRLWRQIWNVMKVFWVALAVYLALTVKIWLIDWDTDEVVQFDYFELSSKDFERIDEKDGISENSEEHGSASVFDKLCVKYPKICKKVSFSKNFSDSDKSINFAYIVFLLQKLDLNIKRGKNPSEALIWMIINDTEWNRRWSANWNTVTIYVGWMKYDKEFFQVISHEIWHIIDLWWLQWVSSKKSKNYTEFHKEVFSIDDPSLEYYKYSWDSEAVRKSGLTREDFCSWYGMSDPFEDFAECHNLYLNHHDYFYKLALTNTTVKEKYNYFANLYGGKYINNSDVNYWNWKNWYRVWDTTRLREW